MADYEVVATGLKFPEGPIAMPDGTVLLVEIARGTLTRVHPDGRCKVVADLGGGPNGAAIGPDGHCYVCNNGGFEWLDHDGLLFPGDTPAGYRGGWIERVNLATGQSERVSDACDGRRLCGPNDLVFDESGGFWFTDNGKRHARTQDRGSVYYVHPDAGRIEEVLFPYEHPNGVALAPDHRTLYFSETLTARIWQFPLAAPGRLAGLPQPFNPANLLHGAGGLTGFDSMAIDSAGNVCQATLFRGGITVVSPAGEVLEFIPLPDPLVTNICFGGPDLRTAWVTLAGTGRLVRMRWPRPGLPLNFLNAGALAPPPD